MHLISKACQGLLRASRLLRRAAQQGNKQVCGNINLQLMIKRRNEQPKQTKRGLCGSVLLGVVALRLLADVLVAHVAVAAAPASACRAPHTKRPKTQ